MSNSLLYTKFNSLPEELKKEVDDFIDKLILRNKNQKKKKGKTKQHGPKFGSAKGMFKMSKDFDEPLDDFKEYMY